MQTAARRNPQVTDVEQVKDQQDNTLAIQVYAGTGAAAATSPAPWIQAGANACNSPDVDHGSSTLISLLHQVIHSLTDPVRHALDQPCCFMDANNPSLCLLCAICSDFSTPPLTLHMLMQMAASHTFRTAEAAIFAIHPSMPLHMGAPMQHPKQQPMWRLKVAVLKDLLRHRLIAHTAMATPEGSRRPPKVAQGHLQTLLSTGPRLLISMGSIKPPMRPPSALRSCPLPLLALVSCGQRQTMSMGSVLPPLDPLPRLGRSPQGPLLAAQVSGVRLSISESARAAAEDAKAQAEAGKAAAEIASVTAEAVRARPRSRCAGWNRPGLQLRQLKQRQRTAGVRLKRHAGRRSPD